MTKWERFMLTVIFLFTLGQVLGVLILIAAAIIGGVK